MVKTWYYTLFLGDLYRYVKDDFRLIDRKFFKRLRETQDFDFEDMIEVRLNSLVLQTLLMLPTIPLLFWLAWFISKNPNTIFSQNETYVFVFVTWFIYSAILIWTNARQHIAPIIKTYKLSRWLVKSLYEIVKFAGIREDIDLSTYRFDHDHIAGALVHRLKQLRPEYEAEIPGPAMEWEDYFELLDLLFVDKYNLSQFFTLSEITLGSDSERRFNISCGGHLTKCFKIHCVVLNYQNVSVGVLYKILTNTRKMVSVGTWAFKMDVLPRLHIGRLGRNLPNRIMLIEKNTASTELYKLSTFSKVPLLEPQYSEQSSEDVEGPVDITTKAEGRPVYIVYFTTA